MMDPELVKELLVGTGPTGVLAVVIFFMYRRDMKGQRDILMTALHDNTRAITTLVCLVERLKR